MGLIEEVVGNLLTIGFIGGGILILSDTARMWFFRFLTAIGFGAGVIGFLAAVMAGIFRILRAIWGAFKDAIQDMIGWIDKW